MKSNHCSRYLKSKNMLITFGFVALIFTHINANAVGLGVYGGTSTGSANWSQYSYPDFGTGLERREYGFVLDTAVAKDKVFNYRLQIGHVEASYDGLEFSGETVINTFGFGIVRTQAMRLWLGPQIGMRDLKSKVGSIHNGGIEYGAVIGMNFHVSPSVSLTAEAGRRFSVATVDNGFNSADIKEQRNFINLGVVYHFEDWH